jgi:hypothetical protein
VATFGIWLEFGWNLAGIWLEFGDLSVWESESNRESKFGPPSSTVFQIQCFWSICLTKMKIDQKNSVTALVSSRKDW